jgi:KaiC/GvpD/RAD55 family RecA-like ATPase
MTFQKAIRKKAKLRLALTGPSGSGKTYSALLLAKGIGGRVAVIDTEHSSASLYADVLDFDVLNLAAPFSPERYIHAIQDAAHAGYDVLIVDSITHEWNGKGGILEIHDAVTRANPRGNSYTAWAEVTPRHNAFVEALLQSPLHLIVTMRSKQDFVLTDRNGKQVPQKVGLAPIQRDGFEYEMTVVLDIEQDKHLATASKDRTRLFFNATPEPITKQTGRQIVEWLEAGANVITVDERNRLLALLDNAELSSIKFCEKYGLAQVGELPQDQLNEAMDAISEFKRKKQAQHTPLPEPVHCAGVEQQEAA